MTKNKDYIIIFVNMSQHNDKVIFTYEGNDISISCLTKLCNQVVDDKVNNVFQDNYIYLLQVVQSNDLQYDSLKIFSRMVSSFLRAEAHELIDLILSKPPKFTPLDESSYIKSFEAYKEFCMHLLAFNCACIKKVTNYSLIEALKL